MLSQTLRRLRLQSNEVVLLSRINALSGINCLIGYSVPLKASGQSSEIEKVSAAPGK